MGLGGGLASNGGSSGGGAPSGAAGGKLAGTYPNPGLNAASTDLSDSSNLIRASVTMAGAAAADGFKYDPVTFLGVVDPIWKIGYNPDGIVAAEPQFYVGIEGNYRIAANTEGMNDGIPHNKCEWYVNYESADGTTVVNYRPIYCNAFRDSNASHFGQIIFDVGTAGFPGSQVQIKADATNIAVFSSGGLFMQPGMAVQLNGLNVLTAAPQQGLGADSLGMLAYNYDPVAVNGGAGMISGSVYLCKVPWPATKTVTNVCTLISTGGATLTAAQNLMGIYSSAGVLLATTVDQSVAWLTNGFNQAALTAPTSIPGGAGQYIYVAIMFNGTTAPQICKPVNNNLTGGSTNNGNLSAANLRWGTIATGRTTLPASVTMSSLAAGTAGAFFAGVS